jgi:hypothetical protein
MTASSVATIANAKAPPRAITGLRIAIDGLPL